MQYREHIPIYSHHKPSGRAKIVIDGKTIYLGTHGTAASKAEYNRVIGEWMSATLLYTEDSLRKAESVMLKIG